jgi:hypothetical protein
MTSMEIDETLERFLEKALEDLPPQIKGVAQSPRNKERVARALLHTLDWRDTPLPKFEEVEVKTLWNDIMIGMETYDGFKISVGSGRFAGYDGMSPIIKWRPILEPSYLRDYVNEREGLRND